MEEALLFMYGMVLLQVVTVLGGVLIGAAAGATRRATVVWLFIATVVLGILPIAFFGSRTWFYGPGSYLLPLCISVGCCVAQAIYWIRKRRVLS
jgi:hypothetical protein